MSDHLATLKQLEFEGRERLRPDVNVAPRVLFRRDVEAIAWAVEEIGRLGREAKAPYLVRFELELCGKDRLRLEAENAELREIVTEFGTAGVEMDDPRIGYVVLQVDRETFEEAKRAVLSSSAEGTLQKEKGNG